MTTDRILPLTELLLGAAYADKELKDQEREEVRALLQGLTEGALPDDVEKTIKSFDPGTVDLTSVAAKFKADPEADRKKVLYLVAAVNEADDEIDFAEDDYLRDLGAALGLPKAALEGLTVEIEAVELKETFQKVRKGPPPPPKSKASIDVDVETD